MELLESLLWSLPEFRQCAETLDHGEAAAITGLGQIHRGHWIAGLRQQLGRPLLVVCQDDLEAQRTAAELGTFLGEAPPVLPTRDLTLYQAATVSRGWEHKRLRALWALARGETPLLVTSLEALSLRTIPKQTLFRAAVTLRVGGTYDLEQLTAQLVALGYVRGTLVEGPGQFALRGGILDVHSPAHDQPVRVEFFGDELDTMGFFDVSTQRRTDNVDELVLLPAAECQPGLHPEGLPGLLADLEALIARQRRRKHVNEALIATLQADMDTLRDGLHFTAADRYMALIYPETATAADYLPAEAAVILINHRAMEQADRGRAEELGMTLDGLLQTGMVCGDLCEFSLDFDTLCEQFRGRGCLYIDSFLSAAYPTTLPPKHLLSVTVKQLPSYGGSLDTAAIDLEHYRSNDYGTLVLCGNRRRGEILRDYLQDRDIPVTMAFPATALPKPGEILLTEGSLTAGMEYPSLKLAVLTEGQLNVLPTRKVKARKKSATNRQKLNSFTDLSPGDLVVHEYHGIGRYVGMEQMKVDGVRKDYVKIAYQGTDTLFVPATQLDLVSKYIGGGEDAPVRLNKLGGDTWQKTKAKAKAAAKEMAAGLIKLYAERKRRPGYAFSADSPWQREFEDSFPYAETDDQLRCIAEIKGDMELPIPMDRLLCGDVGFGKTEVALRAAMKCIMDGKQVAILVPTTVLAQQHYVTAMNRFRSFPVNIAVLSRFTTAGQQRAILRELAAGAVDLVIGTHKLLQKTVVFKDLGLLIIDEEQRFGVSHKERLKEMSVGIDVLTLSATPIPRTLNMALSGIRDMSTIETPPGDRYPVQTYVLEHDERILTDAMQRELARGGQVYYLHNRVESIEQQAGRIRKWLGDDVSIAVAHGKMGEDQLSEVMQRMSEGEIQVLVCTTIIETGIDISNANTLIIEDADRLGLAQLHQLRGRVGRSSRHAFAYLTYRKGRVLTEVAEKRLGAIREFAEFGSGFKIAMRDLEIRGAGNLLGAEQSGHMMSVGYDMYLKLLEEAVLEERGEQPQSEVECTADLVVEANLPESFVASGEQRMDLYRRMAAIRTEADAEDLLDEVVDRFGEPPRPVMNLMKIALLRAKAASAGIKEISQKGPQLRFTLTTVDFPAISAVCTEPEFKGRILFAAGDIPILTLKLRSGETPLKLSEDFVKHYAAQRAVLAGS
jgi:transcription-repair coupling factor (superfamily II helicase)